MPLDWLCDAPGCTSPPSPYHAESDCPLCCKQFCMKHFENHDHHICWPFRSDEIVKLGVESLKENNDMFSTLNMDHIVDEAASLRPGHTCTGPPQPFLPMREDPNIMAGGINGHFILTWDDGAKWLVRMRQRRKKTGTSFDAERMDLKSDAATCIVLNRAGVKVPLALIRPDDTKDNLHYFFVEQVQGRPFPLFGEAWKREERISTDETRARIKEVAKFYISLEGISFPKCGSLTLNGKGEVEVGPRISPNPPHNRPPWFVGPCATAKQLYMVENDAIIQNCMNGTMFRPSGIICGYLVALEIRELLLQSEELDEGPWYIAHGEPRGDHFLFDPEGQLAGVIDWEWAYITCKAEAFSPPFWYPEEDYLDGLNDPLGILERLLGQAYIDLGRTDLAELIPKARKFQRLRDAIGSSRTEIGFLNALRRAFLGQPDSYRALQPKDWREWVRIKMDQHKDDPNLQSLLEKYEWDAED